jgi:hypothetical protein
MVFDIEISSSVWGVANVAGLVIGSIYSRLVHLERPGNWLRVSDKEQPNPLRELRN